MKFITLVIMESKGLAIIRFSAETALKACGRMATAIETEAALVDHPKGKENRI